MTHLGAAQKAAQAHGFGVSALPQSNALLSSLLDLSSLSPLLALLRNARTEHEKSQQSSLQPCRSWWTASVTRLRRATAAAASVLRWFAGFCGFRFCAQKIKSDVTFFGSSYHF